MKIGTILTSLLFSLSGISFAGAHYEISHIECSNDNGAYFDMDFGTKKVSISVGGLEDLSNEATVRDIYQYLETPYPGYISKAALVKSDRTELGLGGIAIANDVAEQMSESETLFIYYRDRAGKMTEETVECTIRF